MPQLLPLAFWCDNIITAIPPSWSTRSHVKSITPPPPLLPSQKRQKRNDAAPALASVHIVSIPESVTTSKEHVFEDCASLLTDVHIPTSVTTIETDVFGNCPIKNEQSLQRISDYFMSSNGLKPKLSDSFQEGNGPTHDFQGATQKG